MGSEPTATAALRDWPCTNADHMGLCSDDHVHADHVAPTAADWRRKGRGVLPDTILGESPCTDCRGSGSAAVAALPESEVRPTTTVTHGNARSDVR